MALLTIIPFGPPKIGVLEAAEKGSMAPKDKIRTHREVWYLPSRTSNCFSSVPGLGRAWYRRQSAKLAPAGSAFREELLGVETSEKPST